MEDRGFVDFFHALRRRSGSLCSYLIIIPLFCGIEVAIPDSHLAKKSLDLSWSLAPATGIGAAKHNDLKLKQFAHPPSGGESDIELARLLGVVNP